MMTVILVILAIMVVWLTVALAASIWFLHEIVMQDRDMAALEGHEVREEV